MAPGRVERPARHRETRLLVGVYRPEVFGMRVGACGWRAEAEQVFDMLAEET